MIKYIGSKRLLAPVLGEIARIISARTALDLFTGTTRVAQEFKRRGIRVTAVDSATYSEVLAQCFIEADATQVDKDDLQEALRRLANLPGRRGYFTKVFCEQSRYLQPFNGERVDAVRDCLETDYRESPLFPILLTSLMLAADRVDSTTGLQMAYLKQWAPRSHNELELRLPALLPGPGVALRDDALSVVDTLPLVDIAYIDPPYNQHRYFTNYHVWETLVRWDSPDHYGIACKRADAREDHTKSPFNSKPKMPAALESVITRTRAKMILVSYNDESWVTPEQIVTWLRGAGHQEVQLLAYDSKRYVGAQIGIFNPSGSRVGKVSHLRNTEYIFVAGAAGDVSKAVESVRVTPNATLF